MKKSVLALYLCFCTTFLSAQDRMTREEYIKTYSHIAIEQMIQTGIPASITMAQACLESGNGNSTLAREANNHFGIKCHDWDGEGFHQDDDEKNECFRKYDNPEESFRDHSDFLKSRERYASLFSLEPDDYKGWAYGLKKAGYATAPDYAQKLIKIIEESELYKLDNPDTIDENADVPAEAVSNIAVNSPSRTETETGTATETHSHIIYLNREIHREGKTAYIIANGYDTYSSLAKDYNLFKKEILRFNGLKKEKPIPAGAKIYIERKKKEKR